ncbi:MAG: flagellar hook protein FlgE [Planctomycetes bacterium]|nr:flagellar hook protein FlgE [Planctomycetota bacterium]
MANSLFTGVSGLRAHQEMLDVVGNNLANTNTIAFKSQRVRFADLIYQTLNQGSSSTSSNIGGTNPVQVGLGVKVAAIDSILQQGNIEATENDLDMALQGSGFFVASDGVQNHFTRAGAFDVDSKNFLVDPAIGYRIQRFGTVGEGGPNSPAFQVAGDNNIKIPIGTGIPGKATATITMQGNLSANASGPLAQTLTSSQPFTSGNAASTAATTLDSLDDNTVNYVAGDQLLLQGALSDGTPVNATIPISVASATTTATTLGDLVTAINAAFAGPTGATASIVNGNIVVQANTVGASSLNMTLSDAAGNTGATSWSSHPLTATTVGQAGDTVSTGIQFFDTQGTAHNITMVYQKQGNNVWNMTASMNPTDGVLTDNSVTGITFNDDGSFRQVTGTGAGNGFLTVQVAGLGTPQTIALNLGTANGFDGLTQVGGNSSAVAREQDGFAAGFLASVSVAQDGVINGIFTNGRILPLAQMAIASFANPAALLREGNNYYGLSSESGTALIGAGLTGGRGSVQQKALESSNVDVAQEFTRLIIAQRGFQVNARTLTVSDQVLQELANIIRT